VVNGSGRHLLTRLLATFVCVAGVPILIVILVRWFFDVPLSAFRPVLNDEVAYWHQALTFAQVGFRGGYYVLSEVPNASGFTPFGPHGPGFAVLSGLFGWAFGWYRHSPVIMNLVAISAAAWTWISISRLTNARLLLSGLLLVTCWQMIFWAPTGMQEAVHQAGAIVMAALFVAALGPSPHRAFILAGWIVLGVLSFIRPSWIILLPVWAAATARRSSGRVLLAAVAGSLAVAGVILFAYSRSTAPYGAGFFFLRALDLSIGARGLADNLAFNLQRTVMIEEYAPLEVLHRAQYWGFLVLAFVLAILACRRARTWREAPASHLLVTTVVMSAAMALMLLLYTLTNWAEHRVLSAFLLFGALLCVAAPGRAPLLLACALIVSNLVTTRTFLESFRDGRRDHFVWDRRGVYELTDALAGHVAYQPRESRWCNTLLTSQYPPYLIAVPAGIGLSVVREPDQLDLPLRSRYLLLDEPSFGLFKAPLHVSPPLATLPYGTLYLNLDAQCE
jgi:hypothetical protein